MNRIHISHTRCPDGLVSGLDATGLTDPQLRHYALEAGFGIIGNSDSAVVYIGSRRTIERLYLILEMAGYVISADAYDVGRKELVG